LLVTESGAGPAIITVLSDDSWKSKDQALPGWYDPGFFDDSDWRTADAVYPDCNPPSYRPDKWNDYGPIQFNNNCYNYGNDEVTWTYAQPGRACGQRGTRTSLAKKSGERLGVTG
jgi:hypothetical protein